MNKVIPAIGTTRCPGIPCRRTVAPHDPSAPSADADTPAPDGAPLCGACVELLVRQVGKLPALFAECGRRLSDSGPRKAERVSGRAPSAGLAFNTAAAEARSAIVGVLASWSALIADGRGITAPAHDVGALAAFLVRHAGWLGSHEAAADSSREINHVVRQAHRVIDPDDQRRVKIGSCVEEGCRGELVALVRAERRRAAPSEVRCSLDTGHRWQEHQWLQLSQRLAPVPGRPAVHRDPPRG